MHRVWSVADREIVSLAKQYVCKFSAQYDKWKELGEWLKITAGYHWVIQNTFGRYCMWRNKWIIYNSHLLCIWFEMVVDPNRQPHNSVLVDHLCSDREGTGQHRETSQGDNRADERCRVGVVCLSEQQHQLTHSVPSSFPLPLPNNSNSAERGFDFFLLCFNSNWQIIWDRVVFGKLVCRK